MEVLIPTKTPSDHLTDWHTCSQRGETNEQNHLDMVQYCQNIKECNGNAGALKVLLHQAFLEQFSEDAESKDLNISWYITVFL